MIMPHGSTSNGKDGSERTLQPPSDALNLTPQQQDTVANFDKISFLSDQVP